MCVFEQQAATADLHYNLKINEFLPYSEYALI
jgi:hypothetical protein